MCDNIIRRVLWGVLAKIWVVFTHTYADPNFIFDGHFVKIGSVNETKQLAEDIRKIS